MFDEWVRQGLRDVIVGPGSRSTPLALAAAAQPGLRVEVRIDERGAGFFALGRALASARPVAIVVTSGTAAAELHAAVAEADLAEVPLLVVTADRPPELRGVGAPQTIDQLRLYGAMVRRFDDPGVPRHDARPSWRPLATNLWDAATGGMGPPGPVHLNVSLVEPLVGDAAPLPAGRPGAQPWRVDGRETLATSGVDLRGRRVLAVVGRGVSAPLVSDLRRLGWAVIGDATTERTTPYADPMLRDEAFAAHARPDIVVRLGGSPASRVLGERLASWGVSVLAWRGAGRVSDPAGLVERTLPGVPDASADVLRADPGYAQWWDAAAARVGEWFAARPASEDLDEVLVARAVVDAASRAGASLLVGSSMPVRDVEWWAPARTTPTHANRGANGIDGVVSTALGVAAGGRAVGLLGDVTLRHDLSGLAEGLGRAGGSCALVVADNAGGGIFSFLHQAAVVEPSTFEHLFGTPRSGDLVEVARALGARSRGAQSRGELARAIDEALDAGGLSVIVARVPDRAANVAIHDRYVRAVAEVAASVVP